MIREFLLKLFVLLISSTFMLTSCSSDADDSMSSEEKQEEKQEDGEGDLTQAQKDFIEVLKSKYPTQVVNFNTETAIGNAPYVKNQKLTFTFSSSGMLFIDTNPEKNDGSEIELPGFIISGKEYVWKDVDKDLSYALSLKADNTINEVNVSKSSDNTFYNSLKVSTDEIEVEKTYSFLLLPGDIECTAQTRNKIETDQRLITMRTKFCDGSQKSVNFNFKADTDISTGTYPIQATTSEERNPDSGKVAVRLFIDGENYYGTTGSVIVRTNSKGSTTVDCVFESLVLKNAKNEEIVISGQILGV
ncbi:hypothetical protein ACXGQW_04570 [Wenyingzhuangia sp. IMCC45533]